MTSRPTAVLVVLAVALAATSTVALQVGASQPPATETQSISATQAQLVEPNNQTESFTVLEVSAPESAGPNQSVAVTALVENPGTETAIQPVELRIDGDVVDRKRIAVEGGSVASVEFEASTSGLDAGSYVYSVYTASDGANGRLEISESFEVTNLTAPENASVGDTVNVTATVSNPNNDSATQQVEFRIGGTAQSSEQLTLDADESAEFATEVDTAGVEPGIYAHGVFARDAGELALLEVTDDGNQTDGNQTDAAVEFINQETDGTNVTIESVTVPEGGFLTIHDETFQEGQVVSSVIGVSEYLEPGTTENVTVTLFDVPGAEFNETELNGTQTLIAMPHQDTNDNETYDFVLTNGSEDGPYTTDGTPIIDLATATVGAPPGTPIGEEETPTATTPTATDTATDTPTATDTATDTPTATDTAADTPTTTDTATPTDGLGEEEPTPADDTPTDGLGEEEPTPTDEATPTDDTPTEEATPTDGLGEEEPTPTEDTPTDGLGEEEPTPTDETTPADDTPTDGLGEEATSTDTTPTDGLDEEAT